jgi:hypothetical protein
MCREIVEHIGENLLFAWSYLFNHWHLLRPSISAAPGYIICVTAWAEPDGPF